MRNGKKGWVRTALILLLTVLLTGCQAVPKAVENITGTTQLQKPEGTYAVYYRNAEGDALVSQNYRPSSETFDEILSELLVQLEQSPSDSVQSGLAGGTTVNTFVRGVDNITVDLSFDYLSLGSVDQVLLRAAVVKTLVQLPGVEKVYLTVEDQPVSNESGDPIGPMSDESFIETHGEGINSLQTAELVLYFADADGSGLRAQNRTVRYSSNLILEEVVAEALTDGSTSPDALSVADAGTVINSISVSDTVCTIDFGSSVNDYGGKADPETALYAFVNSICENCPEIESVQISIDGSTDKRFRSQISLEQTFLPRPELLETESMEETEMTA